MEVHYIDYELFTACEIYLSSHGEPLYVATDPHKITCQECLKRKGWDRMLGLDNNVLQDMYNG